MPKARKQLMKTWSSPSNTVNNGPGMKQSTQVKVRDVEGEEVEIQANAMDRRSAKAKVQGSLGTSAGATENAQPQAGASARRPFRLQVGTKMA